MREMQRGLCSEKRKVKSEKRRSGAEDRNDK